MLPVARFSPGRKHVVVHPDHHRNEDYGVIEEVKFHARKEELQYAERHRLAHEIMVERSLSDQSRCSMWCQNWITRATVHHLRLRPVKPLRSTQSPISIISA